MARAAAPGYRSTARAGFATCVAILMVATISISALRHILKRDLPGGCLGNPAHRGLDSLCGVS